ncbi:MAG: hypothetical protein HOV83_36850 [Catenulispora sp.]|nr:hypothetical protein [Catenulispora sp.]
MQQWQYRQIKVPQPSAADLTARLNELGRAGWEVVAFVPEQSTMSVSSARYAGVLLLKRPLEA